MVECVEKAKRVRNVEKPLWNVLKKQNVSEMLKNRCSSTATEDASTYRKYFKKQPKV